jgi:hypothetical protein
MKRRRTIRPQRKPRCARCGASLVGPRLVLDGQWTCPVCAYEREFGPVERVRRERRPAAPPQEKTLFPLPPPVPPERRRAE